MKKLLAIIKYTFIENLRNKMLYIILVFTAFVFFTAFLFSQIAGEQEIRIIFDTGLTTIELFSFILAIFISVRLILSEIEGKTLYLVFSKPVKRHTYLVGRYLGILTVLAFNIAVMAAALFILLVIKKWNLDMLFFYSVGMVFAKMAMISAVAVFFSLATTSSATAIVVSFFAWILGHAISEMKYLVKDLHNVVLKALLTVMSSILPNFQIFNLKEYPVEKKITAGLVLNDFGYALSYVAIVIILSVLLFRKKEL